MDEVYILPNTNHSFPPFSEKLFGRYVIDRKLVYGICVESNAVTGQQDLY